jgi:aryl-alcohol dehydrogenase-like predicted oxidoreductase
MNHSPARSQKPIPGFATPETTHRPQGATTRILGKTGLTVSTLGFGSYRTGLQQPEHEQSLLLALEKGCNLIDTSTNYMDGDAERMIGQALRKTAIPREQIVLVSKVGYAQGQNLKGARARELEGRPYPEMNRIHEDCWHCISPEWIRDQIRGSLDRLGVECLDIVLLHNPEYFFQAKNSSREHTEYYRRIEIAFQTLEEEVTQGRIRWYGVSSNTFPDPRESEDYTSLEALIEIAEKHEEKTEKLSHFAVIQLPFNLLEPGALLEPNQSGHSTLEFAHEKALGVLINRPLNAFTEKKLVRLADFPHHHPVDTIELAQRAFQNAMDVETACPWAEQLEVSRIAWAHILKKNWSRIGDLLSWRDAFRYQVSPTFEEMVVELKKYATEETATPLATEFMGWIERYENAERALFQAVTAMLEQEAAFRSRRISAALDEATPLLKDCSSCDLSQKAIRVLLGAPGVTSVLLGMRTPAYVSNALNEPLKPLPEMDTRKAFEKVIEKILVSPEQR